jgi:hypothetical protein
LRHGLRRFDQVYTTLERGNALHGVQPSPPDQIVDLTAGKVAAAGISQQMIERPVRGGDGDRGGALCGKRGCMLAAELIAVVHVDVVGTEAGLRPLRARYQNELIVQEHSAREIIRRRGHEAKGEIDQAGPEPAVHLQAFARPQCESDLGAVPAHVLEEALPDAPPKIELQADVADALESLGKGDLVAGLAPELGHHLGITLEFESRGGELGAGLPPMQ